MNPPLQSKGGAPAPQGAMKAEKASGLRLCEAAKAHPVGRLSPREASGDLSYKNLAGGRKKASAAGRRELGYNAASLGNLTRVWWCCAMLGPRFTQREFITR